MLGVVAVFSTRYKNSVKTLVGYSWKGIISNYFVEETSIIYSKVWIILTNRFLNDGLFII